MVTVGGGEHTSLLGPALAIVGAGSTVMVTLLALPGAQGLVSDQVSTLRPTAKFVTVVVGLLTLAIVPLPWVITQVPMPPVGVCAARTALAVTAQTVWLDPALAVLGTPTTTIWIVAVLLGQAPPFPMLHCNIFVPTFSVTWVLARLGLAKVPPPCRNDHARLSKPINGVLADTDMTELVMQTVWLGVVIDAVVGAGLTEIVTTPRVIPHAPFCIFHWSRLLPSARLVTVLFPALGLVTMAGPPSSTVQKLGPTVGM